MSDLILVFSGVVFLEKLMLLVFLYVVGFALFQFRDPIDVVMELSETLSTWISLPFFIDDFAVYILFLC